MTIQQTLTEAMPNLFEQTNPAMGEALRAELAAKCMDALASLAGSSGLLVIDTRTGQVCELRSVEPELTDVGSGYVNVVNEDEPLFAVVRPEGSQQP